MQNIGSTIPELPRVLPVLPREHPHDFWNGSEVQLVVRELVAVAAQRERIAPHGIRLAPTADDLVQPLHLRAQCVIQTTLHGNVDGYADRQKVMTAL